MDVQLNSMGEITHDQQEYMDRTPYMNMIGALRYAADSTRPDISYVTGQLARYLQKYNSDHYLAAKHVFQYLKGSSDVWLVLGRHGNLTTQGFCDADGMVTEGNRAILGYAFQFGTGTVSWSSKRGNLVPFSTFEAEIQGLAYATKEAIWLKHFTNEVLCINDDLITIYCDNMATIKVVKSEEMTFNYRMKHLNLRKNVVCDYIQKKIIDVVYVPTKDQRADILTKALDAVKSRT